MSRLSTQISRSLQVITGEDLAKCFLTGRRGRGSRHGWGVTRMRCESVTICVSPVPEARPQDAVKVTTADWLTVRCPTADRHSPYYGQLIAAILSHFAAGLPPPPLPPSLNWSRRATSSPHRSSPLLRLFTSSAGFLIVEAFAYFWGVRVVRRIAGCLKDTGNSSSKVIHTTFLLLKSCTLIMVTNWIS